jgi:protein-tyrosine phosphatase
VIDIHSHILPKIDDGARSLDEALKMAAIAAEDGIEQMVCTPHMFNGLSRNPEPSEIEDRVGELQHAIGSSGLTVLPGNEVRFSREIAEQVRTNRVEKLNRQNYMLVEFPTTSVPKGAGLLFNQLLLQGVNPILVHPERNLVIQRQPSIVADLVEQGVFVQVTAMSVTGQFGVAAKICADSLLKHNCVHFLATDTHRPEKRPPILSRGRDAAAAIIGSEPARRLVEQNPLAVVTGSRIVPGAVVPYEESPRPSLWTFFGQFFRR